MGLDRGARVVPEARVRLGWLSGIVYYGIVLYWIAPTIATYTRITMPVAIVLELMLAAVAGFFIGAFAAFVEWHAASGISRVIAAPAVWIVLEWSRTFFPAAFPWGFVGYSQFEVLPIIQIVDIAGIYGLSALIVLVNAALVEFLRDGVRRHVSLTIAFATDSWAEIYDGSGKAVLYDLGRAGTQRTIAAAAPLSVTFGNSPAVTLHVNGRPAAMPAPPSGGTVARFRIEADGTVR